MEFVVLPEATQTCLSDSLYHVKIRTTRSGWKMTSIAYLYPYPPCSVHPPIVSQHSFPTIDIFFWHQRSTFVKHGPISFLHLSSSPFLWPQSILPKLPPAQMWTCIPLTRPAENLFKGTVGEICFALRQKNTSEDLRTVAQPLSLSYTTVFLSTRRASVNYTPMRTAFALACVTMNTCLLYFSIRFTLSQRQWQRLSKHAQRFFCGKHDRFPHIIPTLTGDETDSTTTFR